MEDAAVFHYIYCCWKTLFYVLHQNTNLHLFPSFQFV